MNEQQFLSCVEKFADRRYVKQKLISALINKLTQEDILKRCFAVLDKPEAYNPKVVYGALVITKSL